MRAAPSGRVYLLCLWTAMAASAAGGSQVSFPSPADAARALLGAVEAGDYELFLSIAGPQMAGFWSSGDPQRDAIERDLFVDAAHRRGVRIDQWTEDRKRLYAGNSVEPFPAPLVRAGAAWRFDGEAGAAEVAARRIRRNESAIVELCHRFLEAEFNYRSQTNAFAERIRSTPGLRDGLIWDDPEADDNLLGPAFADAAFFEPPPGGQPRPLFGYYVKLLLAQGPDAPGGSIEYRVNGRLQHGVALIAWPAGYGVEGLETFLVSHSGGIFQKDQGPATSRLAEGITAFNPDCTWSRLK